VPIHSVSIKVFGCVAIWLRRVLLLKKSVATEYLPQKRLCKPAGRRCVLPRMVKLRHLRDVSRLIETLPVHFAFVQPQGQRQTLMFSATMPAKIKAFAESALVDPIEVSGCCICVLCLPAQLVLPGGAHWRQGDAAFVCFVCLLS
jgi:hypothetical protein